MAAKKRPAHVTVDARGRVTLPVEARRAVRLEPGASLEVEGVDGRLVLTPAVFVPREDAWAYTPEHLARVERARADVREGRVYRLGSAYLEKMIADISAPR